jgi:hypothetical protein
MSLKTGQIELRLSGDRGAQAQIVQRSTRFRKYRNEFGADHSLAVVAPFRAARVSKRCCNTWPDF